MRVLSFPTRLAPNGSLVTVDLGSDDYFAEGIAVLLLTIPGERPMAPELGAGDLAYTRIAASGIRHQASRYLPEVDIEDVRVEHTGDGTANVEVTFQQTSEGRAS